MPPFELPAYPRIWPLILALLLIIPAWVATLHLWIRPDVLQPGRLEIVRSLALYLVPPVIAIVVVLGVWSLIVAHRRSLFHENYRFSIQEVERQKNAEDVRAQKERLNHQFTLEVIGLGLSLEKFRQSGVWRAVENLNGALILPTDPKSYEWSETGKGNQSSKRSDDAFEHAASYFTEKWLCPGFVGTSANHNPTDGDTYILEGLPDGLRQGAGMAWHVFSTEDFIYSDEPEVFLERVFRFFDENPDVPAAVLWMEDGLVDRNVMRKEDAPPLLTDGYRKPTDMTESMVGFVLARRDRLEAIRASALDVPLQDYPWPAQPMPQSLLSSNHLPFWEHPQPFRPTRWLPRPWCKEQVQQFDSLPVLGRIHRPQMAIFERDGKPLGPASHEESFKAAWTQALATLPQGREPARVIYDSGPQAHRVSPLVRVLHDSGSSIDPHGKNGVNLTKALGDTGATSFFVGMALGIYASHEHQDVSAIVSFRRSDRATIVMIEPPTPEELRKAHPSGEDPLNVTVVPYEP